jgi:hypothetical protein
MQQLSESDLRDEVRCIQADFHSRLSKVRTAIEAKGLDFNAFFQSTALFDGPMPSQVKATGFAGARAVLRVEGRDASVDPAGNWAGSV